MKKMLKRTASLGAFLGVVLLAPLAHADQAIVVGINHYANLPKSDLKGCVNDAVHMKAVLAKYGFQVTMLTDGKATKQGVLNALQNAAARMKPDEQFAFYFAGHGTTGKDKSANLMLADALVGSDTNDLAAKDLYQQIAAIPAKNRTVMLDSCFSGGMLRSSRELTVGRKSFRTRGYLRPDQRTDEGTSRDLVLVNKADSNQNVANVAETSDSAPVCYFTASRENEQSGEDTIDGQAQGVFTHYLANTLNSKTGSWGDVQKGVGAQVAAYTQDQQHPTLSADYTAAPVLGKPAKAGTPTATQSAATSLWDAYNADHANPFHVLITMDPDQTSVHVNDKLSFEINAGVKGYLLILEHGVSGNVNLLFPQSKNAADALVESGRVVTIPSNPDQKFAPDKTGTERIKVLLFSSQAAAAALLDKMPNSLSLPYSALPTQGGAVKVPGKFDTSDITFEVVP